MLKQQQNCSADRAALILKLLIDVSETVKAINVNFLIE